MPDIREKIEDDRGLLKKIQLIVPGFRGYRIREDLRDSDRILRAEIAKRLAQQRAQLEDARKALVRENPMSKALEDIGGAISAMKRVEGEIQHAEVGYSGIAADVRFKQDEIYNLYDYDISILESIAFIDQALVHIPSLVRSGNDADLRSSINTVMDRVTGLEERFKRRKATITGTGL